jgi:chromosome segregation ATPase
MATLVYSDSDGRDRSFALGQEPVTVGRAPECTIRSEDPRVSRMHARFFFEQNGLWIEDLGSTHGIYVGPNKVQRAPVPPGEVVLIGSLLIRLMPANGTMPPPIGLHGTLATWLDHERKTRVAVEEERNAFAKRVNELHQELAAAKASPELAEPSAGDTTEAPSMAAHEAVRERDEAVARTAALERALAVVQDELNVLRSTSTGDPDEDVKRLRAELAMVRERLVEAERDLADRAEWSTLVGAEHTKLSKELESAKVELDEARAAKKIAEEAQQEAQRESTSLREEAEKLRRDSTHALETSAAELRKARDAKMAAETSAGLQAAEKLAEMDIELEGLRRELAKAKAAPVAIVPADSDARVQELTEQVAATTARAEKAEKELATAQIRAQGAERNLQHANSQSAKAETRVAQLEEKLADTEARLKTADEESAKSRERITALETRVGAGDAPLQAAETRAAQISEELQGVKTQLETSRARITELETAVADAEKAKRDADHRADAAKTEVAAAQVKLADSERRANGMQARLEELGKADLAIAAATKKGEEATSRAATAEQQVTEAIRRAEDAEKRASAADTMAKAMAKDVAEALRRAADADTHKRANAREHAELVKRVEQAEAKNAETDKIVAAADARAAEADARTEQIRKELSEQLEAVQADLAAKLESAKKSLTGKLEAAQRELAAERKTSLALVDRKTQLERELAEARGVLPRAEAAEEKVAELEAQIEALQDRITDLESSLAVAETASKASLGEAGEKITALQQQVVEAAQLRRQVEELEAKLVENEKRREELRAELTAAEAAASSTEEDREKLADALRRATDAERKSDALQAQAETADLAIGRAGALQRQLDEALSKLAFLERDSSRPREMPRPDASEAIMKDRIAAAENRAKQLEQQLADAEQRAKAAHDHAAADLATAQQQYAQAQQQYTQAQQQYAQAQQQLAQAQRAAGELEAQATAQQQRAHELEMQVSELQARVTDLAKRPAPNADAERQLDEAQRKIMELEREVANADNVRSFAAETEREIAQLQRELRDTRAKLTQMTLERDRLESDLRGAREDSETTNRRAPEIKKPPAKVEYDPEATAQADLSKYEPIIAKATELQQKVTELDKVNAQLRAQLADTELRLREAIDRDDDGVEATTTGSQLPIAFAEHLSVLEESIDSLRANMRAASDETAMMDQSDSVIAVSSAVSQAAEHIERARAAIRAMSSAMGLG